MKERILGLAMISLLTLAAVGCGFDNPSNNTATNQIPDTQQTDALTSEDPASVNATDIPDDAIKDTSDDEEKNIEITEVTVTSAEPMDYNCWQISIDGVEEYTELSGDSFVDTPSDGNVYLVLYLKVKNSTGHEDYFNYNNLSAKIDGSDIETTYLVNNPHQYSTLYTDLHENETIGGFLVWEAPAGWQELSVTYSGFEAQDHVRPVIKVSRDDLSAPADYDPVYYY